MDWRDFEDGEFLPGEALQARWRAWYRAEGADLLLGHANVAVVRAMPRRGAFDGPNTPPFWDVGAWWVSGRWWVVAGIVLTPDGVLCEVDAVRRDTVRAVGLAHGPAQGDEDAFQAEFDLEGAGFSGLAGRRWSAAEGTLAVSDGGDPVASGPGLPDDLRVFLGQLTA